MSRISEMFDRMESQVDNKADHKHVEMYTDGYAEEVRFEFRNGSAKKLTNETNISKFEQACVNFIEEIGSIVEATPDKE